MACIKIHGHINFMLMELGTIPTFSGTGGFELHGAEEHYHQLDSSGHMRSGTQVEMQVGRSEWAAYMFCHFVSAVKNRGMKDEHLKLTSPIYV